MANKDVKNEAYWVSKNGEWMEYLKLIRRWGWRAS